MTHQTSLRRKLLAGAVSVATAVAVIAITPVSASWTDSEWTNAKVGTLDCTNPENANISTRGEGRMLSGSLLGIDLDTIAGVPGVTVINDMGDVAVEPEAANHVNGLNDAYADPLNVALLDQTLQVQLGDLLKIPVNSDTGLVGQFAQATQAEVAGASGALTNSGAINTDGTPADYPNIATLSLKGLLSQINEPVANLLGEVTDVSLEVGAVAGRAQFEACDYLWSNDLVDTLDRDYLATGVDLVIDSPTVGALVAGVSNTVSGVQSALNGLTYEVLKPLLETGISSLVNGLLGFAVSLGSVNLTSAVVSIDLSPVNNLLTGSITDSEGVLNIDLATGQIRVDTAALLAEAYSSDPSQQPTHQLNGLAPNTDLLGKAQVFSTLNTALNDALQGWLSSVNAALDEAVANISVNVGATVNLGVGVVLLGTIPLATLTIGVSGSLDDLTVSVATQLAGGLNVLGSLLNPVLALVDSIASGLISGVGGLVREIILSTNGLVRELPEAITDLTGPILQTVSGLYNSLFLSGVVQVLLNAQNQPQLGTNSVPNDLAAIESVHPSRFDVAAIRVGVLGAAQGSEVRIYLGRASAALLE